MRRGAAFAFPLPVGRSGRVMGLYRGSPGPLPVTNSVTPSSWRTPRHCCCLTGSGQSPGSCVICPFTGQTGSDFAGEICDTATERAVMLDGSAQFLGARVFAVPGG